MKFTLVLTTIFAALSSAAVLERGAPLIKQYFKLKVADNGPKEIAGKYFTTSVGGGSLGLYAGQEEFQGYMKGKDTKRGIIYSSKNVKDKVFLSPSHSTPQYFTRIGDPKDDPTPTLVLYRDFVISQSYSKKTKKSKFWLDYKPKSNNAGATSKHWVACGGKDGYQVYFGSTTKGCTSGFQVEVIYAVAKV